MINELNKTENTISSLEVADMIGKGHKELLRDIRRYVEQFNERNLAPVDFFLENTYIDAKGEKRPCFDVTKKGCEFIAHKLTGAKGTEFTAKYINRFHDMEDTLMEIIPKDFPSVIRDFDLYFAHSAYSFLFLSSSLIRF